VCVLKVGQSVALQLGQGSDRLCGQAGVWLAFMIVTVLFCYFRSRIVISLSLVHLYVFVCVCV